MIFLLGKDVNRAVRKAIETKYDGDQVMIEKSLIPWHEKYGDLPYLREYCYAPADLESVTNGFLTLEDLDERGQASFILLQKIQAIRSVSQDSLSNTKLVDDRIFTDNRTELLRMISELSGLPVGLKENRQNAT